MQDMTEIGQMFKDLGLSEMTVKDGDFEISLKKAEPENEPAPVAPASAPAPSVNPLRAAKGAGKEEPEEEGAKVTAPLPGIFCCGESENAEPYVKVGDTVQPDTVVCAIEAMKMYNTVRAGVSGKVKKICAENGDMVEFGQPLLLIEEETA